MCWSWNPIGEDRKQLRCCEGRFLQMRVLILYMLWVEDFVHAFDESDRLERFDNIVVDPLSLPIR